MARRDPDDLIVAALNEGRDEQPLNLTDPFSPEEDAEFRRWARVVAVGRSIRDEDRPGSEDEPPADLWTSLAARAGVDPDAGDDGGTTRDTPDSDGGPGGGAVVAFRRRGGAARWLAPAAVAAAAMAIVGYGLSISGTEPESRELAAADLTVCDDACAGEGSGTARLVQRPDGLHLQVDLSGVEAAEDGDYYELWLLRSDGPPDPLSIERGVDPDGTLDIPLPEDVDTSSFDIVDVSIEDDDGDDTHSGKSILRGRLA